MSYNRLQLRKMILAMLGDAPTLDSLGAIWNSTTTLTFTATDYTKYGDGMKIEIESEVLQVNGEPSSATITVYERGADGTTAATHADDSIVRINPTWFNWQLNSAINDCLLNRVLKEAENTAAVTLAASTYKYDLPAAIKCDRILEMSLYDSDNVKRSVPIREWLPLKGSGTAGVDQIELPSAGGWTAGRKIHIKYLAPFTAFAADNVACDLPDNETAQMIPVWWACHVLMSQRETPRMRRDKGSHKRSSPPQGAREAVSRDWLSDFVSACRSSGLQPNVPGAGPVTVRYSGIR